jgi:hypothetical protein
MRVRNPVDLLALVPVSFGFHPEQSLVLLAFDGPQGFHARVDLPGDRSDIDAVVKCLLEALRRNPARTAALVAYTDDGALAEDVIAAAAKGLKRLRVRVVAALRADAGRWRCVGPCRPACGGRCDPTGTPYDLSGHPFTAAAVFDGQVTHRSRAALQASLVWGDPAETEVVSKAVSAHAHRCLTAARHPLGPWDPAAAKRVLVAEGHWVGERVRAYLSDGRRLSADDAGRMLAAIGSVQVRDVAWAEMSRAVAGQHVELWTDLVRRAPLDVLAPAAALLAFAAWLHGDGALAWCALERCHESDPGYTMASLLAGMLDGAVPPTVWTPLDKADLPLFATTGG